MEEKRPESKAPPPYQPSDGGPSHQGRFNPPPGSSQPGGSSQYENSSAPHGGLGRNIQVHPQQGPYPGQPGPYTSQPGAYPGPPSSYPPGQMHPQQGHYGPTGQYNAYGPQGQQSTVIVSVPASCGNVYGENPIQTTCPMCHSSIITQTHHTVGLMAWLIFGVLCFLGCWLCSCIPFCVNSCKDVRHSCPNCHAALGSFKRLG